MMETHLEETRLALDELFQSSASKHRDGAQRLFDTLSKAWSTPVQGKTIAYAICDVIRERGGIQRLVELCGSEDSEIQNTALCALDQSLIQANRSVLAGMGHAIDPFVKLVHSKQTSLVRPTVGILCSLFKHSSATCERMVEIGGLDAVIFACRLKDVEVLRNCASALANCAMYGSPKTQRDMVVRKTADWLFPLAFSDDTSVQYYACLAISILATNKEMKRAIVNSGTLNLVQPFVKSHDPIEFTKSDSTHFQGRSGQLVASLRPAP